MTTAIATAIEASVLPGRVWMYSNYHCNLACSYCLTESAPSSPKRALTGAQMETIALDAAELGFTDLGVTGGEPFLAASMPETLARLASILPTVALTNGTVFSDVRYERLAPLAGLPIKLQISLDSDESEVNDAARGPENFRKVVEAIPRLVERGIGVRIATTIDGEPDQEAMARLCELHRSLGVPDEDHLVRPIVRRGRAIDTDQGVAAGVTELPPELTVTADGTFWSPFGPTVHGDVLDTDLLLTRTITPLRTGAEALLRLLEGRPPGEDARLNIR